MCTCDHKRQHFNIGASRVFACAMEVSLALTDFYWFGSACRISLLFTFFMVLFLMTVGSRVVARVSSMCQTVIFQSEIKLNGSATNAKDVSELFLFFVFASQRSRLCVFRMVDRVWPSTEWSLDPSFSAVFHFVNGCGRGSRVKERDEMTKSLAAHAIRLKCSRTTYERHPN